MKMRKEMACIFQHTISEELRKELAEGKLREYARDASFHNLRGEAMLELGHLDIELNINCLEDEDDHIEEATPTLDYFVCVKYGEDRDDWESYGYADDYIGDAGQAHVDWSAENWEEQLFADMVKALGLFVAEVNKPNAPVYSFYGAQKLKFLTANEYYI
jgi:hypothetical protein